MNTGRVEFVPSATLVRPPVAEQQQQLLSVIVVVVVVKE